MHVPEKNKGRILSGGGQYLLFGLKCSRRTTESESWNDLGIIGWSRTWELQHALLLPRYDGTRDIPIELSIFDDKVGKLYC